jgi:hypothetical protein
MIFFAVWLIPREGCWLVAIPAAWLAAARIVNVVWPLLLKAFSTRETQTTDLRWSPACWY